MNWVRIRCALAALVLVLMAGAARGGVLYWMIDGNASDSFQFAYAQTLKKATDQGGNANSVVARLYSTDTTTGERIDYDAISVVSSEDSLGKEFDGWPLGTKIPSSPDRLYAVELGILREDSSITAYYVSDSQSYEKLVAMGSVQMSSVGTYDTPWNLAAGGWSAVAVPEPSGGLLLLLGTACLMLRRGRHAA